MSVVDVATCPFCGIEFAVYRERLTPHPTGCCLGSTVSLSAEQWAMRPPDKKSCQPESPVRMSEVERLNNQVSFLANLAAELLRRQIGGK